MDADSSAPRLGAAITLLTGFGNPLARLPRPRAANIREPDDLHAKLEEFWATRENYDVHVLERDPKVPLDLTLEILVPKQDSSIESEGWCHYPSSALRVRDVDPNLGPQEIEEIVARKLYALRAAHTGPGRYDNFLMTVRRLAAITPTTRRRLRNGQFRELVVDYFLPFGSPLGRYYFTFLTLAEVRRALRKTGLARVAAQGVRLLRRFLTGS